jgi:hypothetical protein
MAMNTTLDQARQSAIFLMLNIWGKDQAYQEVNRCHLPCAKMLFWGRVLRTALRTPDPSVWTTEWQR